MAKIQNAEVTQKAIIDLKLDAAREKMPLEASDKIVLTYPLDVEKTPKVFSSEKLVTGNMTLGTTSTNKRFFLEGVTYSYTKDSTNDAATDTGFLQVTLVSGLSVQLLRIANLTLTAQAEVITVTFPTPLELEKGSTIADTFPAYTAGLLSRGATAYGYEVDN